MGNIQGVFYKFFFLFILLVNAQVSFASEEDSNPKKVCVHYFEKKLPKSLDLDDVNQLSLKQLINEMVFEAKRLAKTRGKDTEAHWSPSTFENSIVPQLLKKGKNFQQFIILGKQVKTFRKISEELGLEFSVKKSSEYSLFGDDFDSADNIPDNQLVVASVYGDTEKTFRVFVAALKSHTLSENELTSYPFLKDNFRYSLLRQNYSQVRFELGVLPKFSYQLYHYFNEIKDDPKGNKKHFIEICFKHVEDTVNLSDLEAEVRNMSIYDGYEFEIVDRAFRYSYTHAGGIKFFVKREKRACFLIQSTAKEIIRMASDANMIGEMNLPDSFWNSLYRKFIRAIR